MSEEREPAWVSQRIAQLVAQGYCIETRFNGNGYSWENVQYLVQVKTCQPDGEVQVITYLYWGNPYQLNTVPIPGNLS